MKTSITDQPRKPRQEDRFNISQYENGLCTFLNGADTPLTIALQGEWGSGKTSLMYSLREKLCEGPEAKFKHIWINTWEYALMTDPISTLTQIISQITSQIARNFSEDEEISKKIKDGLKKFLKAATRTAVAAVSGGDSTAVDEMWGNSDESTIGELRKQLEALIETYKTNHPECKGLIFFIDDLDRIAPTAAVQLMELLKNLFTLNYCVFVLAIDYEVVVKGLKPKFGEMSEKNEHEFRSFFDKIIQVPFSMPVKQYEVTKFIFTALSEIDYFADNQELDKYRYDIEQIVRLSVGTNPRSIKRLINSISLVKCIYASQNEIQSYKNRFLNLAFIALQVVYPKFYQLLHDKSDFTQWDEDKFLMEHNISVLSIKEKEDLGKRIHELADEPWEGAIKKICETNLFLKRNFLDISKIFNIIRKYVTKPDGSIDTDLISEVIKLSQTTNTQAEIKPSIYYSTNSLINTIFAKLKGNDISISKKSIGSGSGIFEIGNRNPYILKINATERRNISIMEIEIECNLNKVINDKYIKAALKLNKDSNIELDSANYDSTLDQPSLCFTLKTDEILNFTSQDCINAISNLIKEINKSRL